MSSKLLPPRLALTAQLLCSGRSLAEVAEAMGVTLHTVESSRRKIRDRLKVEALDDICRIVESGEAPIDYIKRPDPIPLPIVQRNTSRQAVNSDGRWIRYPTSNDSRVMPPADRDETHICVECGAPFTIRRADGRRSRRSSICSDTCRRKRRSRQSCTYAATHRAKLAAYEPHKRALKCERHQVIDAQATRAGQPWTAADDAYLRATMTEPAPVVAVALGRSYGSVACRRHFLRTRGPVDPPNHAGDDT
jgi:hypothetical protein